MINIGHACSDERGKLNSGAAGDQTGKEVCIRKWYNRPWTCVIRANDANMREKIATAMEHACNNNNIGYDQYQRTTLLTQVRSKGYDPAYASVKCETDCSALVSVCCMYAGISEQILFKNNNLCTTSTLKNTLKSTGKFTVLTESKYLKSDSYLLRGDILLYEGHHVAVALGNGASSTSTKVVTLPQPVLAIGSKGDGVKQLQNALNIIASQNLTVDGDYGNKTANAIRNIQKLANIYESGTYDSATRTALFNFANFNSISVS